jgi:type I restriction enzyme M protein
MAAILVTEPVQNVTVYDPSAGSGTLLMNIAHAIGEDRCTIYSQDISQKASSLLRLNLILNNLVHSIPNSIQGNTMLHPYHRQGSQLAKFDFIVSNPPFKMDFSDYRESLDTKENNQRFFAGIPKIPNKATDKMAIYSLFLQHIIFSLNAKGKAAVVVPTGLLRHRRGLIRLFGKSWLRRGCWRGWFRCRAIFLRRRERMFQFYLWISRIRGRWF